MYKILTHLHTQSPGVWRYHRVLNEDGDMVEFQVETLEEAELELTKVLETVGVYDARVISEQPYYVDIIYTEDDDFNGEDEELVALRMLNHMGWKDLRIADNKPFGIEVFFGTRPEEYADLYTLQIVAPDNCSVEPALIQDIPEGSSKTVLLTFAEPFKSFHLLIDGQEDTTGIPDWISYTSLSSTEGVLTFQGISDSHLIEIVLD